MFRMKDGRSAGVLLPVPSGLVLPRDCPIHTKSPLVLRLITPSTLEIPAPPTLAPRLLAG